MKNWILILSTLNSGYSEEFWTFSGALKYLKTCNYQYNFVDIENKKLKVKIRLYVPDKQYNYSLGIKYE